MEVMERFSAAMNERAGLMQRMLGRLDIDLVAASHAGWGFQVGRAARNCMMCRQTAACRAWLDGAPLADGATPADFCPNARLFADMTHSGG